MPHAQERDGCCKAVSRGPESRRQPGLATPFAPNRADRLCNRGFEDRAMPLRRFGRWHSTRPDRLPQIGTAGLEPARGLALCDPMRGGGSGR